ncbi:MAG: hypothetical protein R3E18_12110 [Sphingomonadaceae bacterium]
MNRELFLAILAMDSYNRGYARRLRIGESGPDGPSDDLGQFLGGAQIVRQSGTTSDRPEYQSGFYAIAYEWNGETIISYRGTDDPAADTNSGYGLGAGYPGLNLSQLFLGGLFDHIYGDTFGGLVTDAFVGLGVAAEETQSNLALEFYSAVTGAPVTDIMSTDVPDDVVVVGHSLGGGLAGLVASLSGAEGYGYDHMPFVQGAYYYAINFMAALAEASNDPEFLDVLAEKATPEEFGDIKTKLQQFGQAYQGTIDDFELAGLRPPSVDNFTAVAVEGELLTYVRNGDVQNIAGFIAAVTAVLTGNLAALAVAIEGWSQAITTPILEATVPSEEISLNGALPSSLDLVKRHSQALLVILKYAEVTAIDGDWKTAAPQLIEALFDDDIGEALGRSSGSVESGGQGAYSPSDQLKAAIAYSAIDEGERPFGDTGIVAWYNDGNVLGRILAQANVSDAFRNISGDLARIAAQYAGHLAFQDVEDPIFNAGVLDTNGDLSALSIDLSDVTWDAGKEHKDMEIVGISTLIRNATGDTRFPLNYYGPVPGQADGVEWASPTRAGSKWLYGVEDPGSIVGRLSVQTMDEAFDGHAPGGSGRLASDEIAVFVLGDGNDRVTGTDDNDFLIGSGGVDTLFGGLGDDMLFGGDENDILSDIHGRNFFQGGAGDDRVDLQVAGALSGYEVALRAVPSPDNDRKTDIEFTLKSALTGVTETNRMQDVEQLVLTEYGDRLTLNASTMNEYVTGYIDPFGTPFTVDMANATSGLINQANFDQVEYLANGDAESGVSGVFWRNGTTQAALPNLSYSQYSILGSFSAVPVLLSNLSGFSFLLEDLTAFDDIVRVKGLEDVILTGEDDSFAFTSHDYSIHSGFGTITAGAGEDVILFEGARFFGAGEYLDPEQQAREEARAAAIAAGQEYTGPDVDESSARASEELRLTIDGGEGDDRLMVRGGEAAIVVGGEGRDFLYNSSYKGQLWGDGLDGRGASYTGAGSDDTFWWSAGSFIMDAGKNDRLQMFGLPIIGGSNAVLFGAGLEKNTARDWVLPFITYGLTGPS